MADRTIVVRIGADVKGLVSGFQTAQKAARDFGSRTSDYISQNEQSINTVSNALGGIGLALTGAAAVAVKKFADFDEAMSSVKASTMESAENMALLRDAAIDAGASTVYSATEAAGAIEELAKAGVSTADILAGGLDGALDLAAAGGIGVAQAAETAASAMTQFGLSGRDVTRIADLLAAGAGKAQGGVSDMGQALNQAGLVASQMGLSIEETVGSLTAFASAGLVGSDAGTSFRAMLLRLANPTGESARLMEELGISAYDASGAFVGMENLAGQLQRQLGGLTQETRNQALAQIFGQDAIRTSAILYEQGAEGIREWTAAVDEQGYAAEVAAARMDNLKGDVEGLMGSLETALIGMGEGADGPLRSLVQSADDVVDAFNELPDVFKQGSLGLIGAAGLVTLGIAGLGKLVIGINNVKLAMQGLNMSAKTARLAVAGVGTAIGIAAVGLTMWAENMAEARARTEAFADTLDGFGRRTDATLSTINKALSANQNDWLDNLFGKDPASLIDKAEKFGLAVDDLQGYILGEAEAIERVNAAMEEYVGDEYNSESRRRAEEAGLFTGALEEQAGALTAAEKAAAQKAKADETAGIASEVLATAVDTSTGAIEAQTDALEELVDAQREAAGEVLSLRDAQRNLEGAYDDAAAALEENGATLDITTEKGRANQRALDNIADSAWDLIDSMEATGASSEDLQGSMETSRTKFIETATAMGMATEDAEALANQLGLIPGNVKANVIVDTDEAKRATDTFIAAYSGRTIPLIVKMSMTQGGFNAAQAAMYSAARSASYSSGGYTGDGGKYEPAGVVHKGEYVINAAQTAKHRGLLEAINRGMPGYALGGMVGAAPSPTLSLPADGWSISGSLNIGGALVPLVDARISAAQQSRTATTRQGVRR